MHTKHSAVALSKLMRQELDIYNAVSEEWNRYVVNTLLRASFHFKQSEHTNRLWRKISSDATALAIYDANTALRNERSRALSLYREHSAQRIFDDAALI